MRINYTIIFVSDMKRPIAFYRDILGLLVKFETPYWTEFATEGVTLALHKADEAASNNNPINGIAGSVRPGFSVPNLNEFNQGMIDYKVRCVEQPATKFGATIAQNLDPDGLAFSVSESRGN